MKIKSMMGCLLAAFVCGCGQPKEQVQQKASTIISSKTVWKPPSAGKAVAGYKERIREDKLNDLYFTVSVVSTESSRQGVYKVVISYGYAKNETLITLPQWVGNVYLKPVLKKGDEPYEVLLGFEAADDIFHPYYEIKALENSIKMDKVMAYHIDDSL